MPISEQDTRQSLMAEDPEFRSLAEEHTRCNSQLEEIIGSSYLNVEDMVREVTLKKLKLRLKDRMEMIVARHQQLATH
jgi:uncharacterized protein YdcH (DUF465 family)